MIKIWVLVAMVAGSHHKDFHLDIWVDGQAFYVTKESCEAAIPKKPATLVVVVDPDGPPDPKPPIPDGTQSNVISISGRTAMAEMTKFHCEEHELTESR